MQSFCLVLWLHQFGKNSLKSRQVGSIATACRMERDDLLSQRHQLDAVLLQQQHEPANVGALGADYRLCICCRHDRRDFGFGGHFTSLDLSEIGSFGYEVGETWPPALGSLCGPTFGVGRIEPEL